MKNVPGSLLPFLCLLRRLQQLPLAFGIECDFDPGEPPVIGSESDHDPAIWQGEHLELLIETDRHSYYQIVLNPAGALIDLDRGVARARNDDRRELPP
jgi:hypothetical protein